MTRRRREVGFRPARRQRLLPAGASRRGRQPRDPDKNHITADESGRPDVARATIVAQPEPHERFDLPASA